jgi:hypothetical protein
MQRFHPKLFFEFHHWTLFVVVVVVVWVSSWSLIVLSIVPRMMVLVLVIHLVSLTTLLLTPLWSFSWKIAPGPELSMQSYSDQHDSKLHCASP